MVIPVEVECGFQSEQSCWEWGTGDCGGVDNGGCPPNYHYTPSGECRENGEGGDDTCFPAGTKITMADGSRKNIEEVRVGERVMSQSEAGGRSSSRVERLIRPISDNMCRIDFDNGESLKVTKSHPFLTDGGWQAIIIAA